MQTALQQMIFRLEGIVLLYTDDFERWPFFSLISKYLTYILHAKVVPQGCSSSIVYQKFAPVSILSKTTGPETGACFLIKN
jgi:hypothetical protein